MTARRARRAGMQRAYDTGGAVYGTEWSTERVSAVRGWWARVRARRTQRRRMDALLESIERRSPVLGRPDIAPHPWETWDEFVARVSRS